MIYYIRHAPTLANLSGFVVEDYDSFGIEEFDVEKWKNKIGCKLPKDFQLYISPVKRCKETAEKLFPGKPFTVLEELSEFDISALGNLKFWEISKKQFNKLIPNIHAKERITKMLSKLPETAVVIGHGFYGRLLYDFLKKTKESTFDILNSRNFAFRNLDMMVIENNNVREVLRYV